MAGTAHLTSFRRPTPLQVLPARLRRDAIKRIVSFVAPGGTLLVIARARDEGDDPGAMPWPLTRSDLSQFEKLGLRQLSLEDYRDTEAPPVRRFRVAYRNGGQVRVSRPRACR